MNEVAHFTKHDRHGKTFNITILRDDEGRWYVWVNGVKMQSKLNASEIVRYLANAANNEYHNI